MASRRSTSRRQLLFDDRRVLHGEDNTSRHNRCELCCGQHKDVTVPKNWKSEPARTFVLALGIHPTSPICSACRKDVTRCVRDDNFKPRWEKVLNNTCCVLDCTDVTFASLNKSKELVQSAFDQGELHTCSDETPIPTPLCKHHYHLVYKLIQPSKLNCTTCNTPLKYTSHRMCPNPTMVEEYLRQHTGYEGHIEESDRVCYICYKSHLVIIQQSTPRSIDSDLEQLIHHLSQDFPVDPVRSVDEAIDRAMKKVTIEVGRTVLQRDVLLLPAIQEIFLKYVKMFSAELNSIDINMLTERITCRMILSHLTANLQHHVTFKCTARKYGTLVYSPNTDILNALAKSLWQQRTHISTSSLNVQEDSHQCTKEPITFRKVLDELNDKMHSQVKHYLAKEKENPFDYANMDLDALINDTDPTLWEAVCLLTRSKSEQRQLSRVSDPSSQAHHIKRVRCFHLLCMILYCTDDRCSLPLHTLITDVIDSQGGTALLIKILNRFGVCASLDTLLRFVQYKSDPVFGPEDPQSDVDYSDTDSEDAA